ATARTAGSASTCSRLRVVRTPGKRSPRPDSRAGLRSHTHRSDEPVARKNARTTFLPHPEAPTTAVPTVDMRLSSADGAEQRGVGGPLDHHIDQGPRP